MSATFYTVEPMDNEVFMRTAAGFRRELLAHCYRMLGSVEDAEDLVQETYLRAWRSYGDFEARSSLRTWLYRIATNACLTALQHKSRRVLPSGLGPPTDDPDAEPGFAPPEIRWLQPFPDALVDSDDPAEIVATRSSLRLALVASLQFLPVRQRAVLILRDVLAFPAAEVAEILDMTVPAVKSALQRARAQALPQADDIVEPDSVEARTVLDRYMAAFETADAKALEELLRSDATLEVAPSDTWFSGKKTCAPYLARHILLRAGEYRMFATVANGQPAAVTYRDGAPFGVAVLTTDATHLVRITAFLDPSLVERFGFPATLG